MKNYSKKRIKKKQKNMKEKQGLNYKKDITIKE